MQEQEVCKTVKKESKRERIISLNSHCFYFTGRVLHFTGPYAPFHLSAELLQSHIFLLTGPYTPFYRTIYFLSHGLILPFTPLTGLYSPFKRAVYPLLLSRIHLQKICEPFFEIPSKSLVRFWFLKCLLKMLYLASEPKWKKSMFESKSPLSKTKKKIEANISSERTLVQS